MTDNHRPKVAVVRPNLANDHGIRGGTRPAASSPPKIPPRGTSAVQNPKPSSAKGGRE
jgi:hypothetical protein